MNSSLIKENYATPPSGILTFTKYFPGRLPKTVNKETTNGWSQVRRQMAKKTFYKPLPGFVSAKQRRKNDQKWSKLPKAGWWKIFPQEPVLTPVSTCAPPPLHPSEIVEKPSYMKVLCKFLAQKSRQAEISAIRSLKRRSYISSFRNLESQDNYLWDIRFLWRMSSPKIRNVWEKECDPFSYYLGYLNGLPVLGPLRKADHFQRKFARLESCRAERRRALALGAEPGKNLGCFRGQRRMPKVEANINVRATSSPRPKKQNRVLDLEDQDWSILDNVNFVFVNKPVIRFRNVFLLSRLRNILLKFKFNRKVKGVFSSSFSVSEIFSGMLYDIIDNFESNLDLLDITKVESFRVPSFSNYIPESILHGEYISMRPRLIDPQMDKDGEGLILTETVEDTTIVHQRIASEEQGPIFTERSWSRLASTEPDKQDDGLTARSLPIGQFDWKTSHGQGEVLYERWLPGEAMKNNLDLPMVLLALQHRFMCPEYMEVEVLFNSNYLQLGQVIMSWYYLAEMDDTFFGKSNIYNTTQMLHARSQAGASNPMLLRIPFAYVYPYLSIQKRDKDFKALNLGTLRIQVLNRLQAASTADNHATGTVFLRLGGCRFMGMVSRSLGYVPPQMETAATLAALSIAESYLNTANSSQNADLPPTPVVPTPVQVYPGSNMSYGTDIAEYVNAFRLSPKGQTPHPGLNKGEMVVSEFASKFGLVDQVTWNVSDANHKLLGYWAASPIWRKRDYPTVAINDQAYYCIPPVAYVANLMAKWRGICEYEFEFVCNQFYSGSVMVAFIPGYDKEVTYDQAKACSYVIYDLKDVRSFTYKTPFITDRPWWTRPYSGGDVDLDYSFPGSIQLFVNNRLALNNVVPNSFEINVYMAGSPEFEVAIPVQPSISSFYYPSYPQGSDENTIYPIVGYAPFYCGTSRYFRNNTYALLRYSGLGDSISYFPRITDAKKKYYKTNDPGVPKYREYSGGNWKYSTHLAQYYVSVQDPGNSYNWMCLCKNEEAAKCYVKIENKLPTENLPYKTTAECLVPYPNDDADTFFGKTRILSGFTVYSVLSVEDQQWLWANPEGERENVTLLMNPPENFTSTSSGMLTFGEDFSSLKTLLRRYQYLGTYTTKKEAPMNILLYPFGMPTFDSGETDKMKLLHREGYLSLIAMCYRYYRGGLRVKLVATQGEEGLVTVMHKPDMQLENVKLKDLHRYPAQGYAQHIVDLALNPVITMEIPFYLDCVMGYLHPECKLAKGSDLERCSNLGRLFVYTDAVNPVEIKVYLALADDARFDVFQCVPPVKFLDEEIVRKIPGVKEIEEVDPQMADDEVIAQGAGLSTLNETKKAAETVNKVGDKVEDMLSKVQSAFETSVKDSPLLSQFFSMDKLVNIVGQFGHMLINPDWRTISLGVAMIFVNIMGAGCEWISKIQTQIANFVRPFWETKQTSPGEVNPQSEGNYDSIGMLGTLGSLVIAAVGAKCSMPGSFLNNMRRLFQDMSIFSRGLEGIVNLIKHLLNCVGRMVRYVLLYRNTTPDVEALLKNEGREMIKWALNCEDLLDPTKLGVRELNELFPDQVLEAYLLGMIYSGQLAATRNGTQAYNYIKATTDRMRELRDRLQQQGRHPFSRLTPFSIWIEGAPGLGKSTMVSSLTTKLLRAINWREAKIPLYKIEPMNDHWDTCGDQPVYWIDDAFAVTTPTAIEKILSTYFCVVNNAPFTPPMAHLYNKFKRISPYVLITTSNDSFPNFAGLSTPEALYRRRHCMVKVSLDSKYADKDKYWKCGNLDMDAFSDEEKARFEWVNFQFYNTPREAISGSEALGSTIKYAAFVEELEKRFKAHYKSEQDAMKRRVDDMISLVLGDATPEADPTEVKTSFYSKVTKYFKDAMKDIEDFVEANSHSWESYYKKEGTTAPSLRSVIRPDLPPVNTNPQGDYEFTEEDLNRCLKTFITGHARLLHTEDRTKFREQIDERAFEEVQKDLEDLFLEDLEEMSIIPVEERTKSEVPLRMEYLIKKFYKQELTPDEEGELNEFTIVWKERMLKASRRRCSHKVCECYRPYVVKSTLGNEYEVLLPGCENCKNLKRKPVRMCPCDDGCLLHNYLMYPIAWHATKMYYAACTVSKFVYRLTAFGLKKMYSAAKIALKACVSTTWYILKKSLKLLKFVLPIVGLYFLGSKIYDSRVSVAEGIGKVYGTVAGHTISAVDSVIDKAGSVVMKTNDKIIELYDRVTGKKYLLPQGSVYEAAQKTKGQSARDGKLVVIKQVTGQMALDQIQGTIVNTYIDDIQRILSNNVYSLIVQYEENGHLLAAKARGIFVRNRQFLTVTHCWDELLARVHQKNGEMFLVKAPSFNLKIHPEKIKVDKFKDSNFVILTFPAIIPEHKDITKHIPTQHQHKLITNRGIVMTVDKDKYIHPVKMSLIDEMTTVRATANSEAVTMCGSYTYDHGGPGVCGSILMCIDTNPCVVGMHVAGIGISKGYSEPLVREMFVDVPKYNNEIVDVVLPDLKDLSNSKIDLEGNFIHLGVVDAQFAHNDPGKSSIVPSLTHGIFPVLTEPMPLHPSDARLPPDSSPMRLGVKKHGEPVLGFPQDLLDFGFESLKAEMRTKISPIIGTNPVSLAEAICGRPGMFPSLNFHSSEGFPLSAYRPSGASSKKWLFDLLLTNEGQKLLGIDKKLLDMLAINAQLRRKKIMPCTVFVDCLKDERRSLEKCRTPGKTRIFSISPVQYSIPFRQYMLPYTVAHSANRLNYSSAVGINVNGYEWTELVLQMASFSPYHACGDYSNFGAGFDAEVHAVVIEAILDWFEYNGVPKESEDQDIRRVLLTELRNAIHLCYNVLYRVVSGMPSGSPITVETNDNVNLVYILMAWHYIMRQVGYGSHYYFNKFIRIKTYGDDLWLSIHPLVVKYFNNETIQNFFKLFGVKYTDADKSGVMIPFKSINDVSFLKRIPRLHPFRPNTYLAELELASILDIANWCWKSKDLKAATLVNLEMCSDSLFSHGPSVHEKYKQILQKEAHKLGFIGNFRSWNELDRTFFGDKEGVVVVKIPLKEEY